MLMSVQPAGKRATYDDLLALPPGERAEVLDGVLVTPPAPLPRHSLAQGATRRFIGGPFDDDDGRGGPGAGGSCSRSTFGLVRTTS